MASYDYVMCHMTPYTSKNVKFRLSWNSMKFNVIARFHETISTVKSVFFIRNLETFRIFDQNYRPFLIKIEFSRVLQFGQAPQGREFSYFEYF